LCLLLIHSGAYTCLFLFHWSFLPLFIWVHCLKFYLLHYMVKALYCGIIAFWRRHVILYFYITCVSTLKYKHLKSSCLEI
jgi:hypothetical protein